MPHSLLACVGPHAGQSALILFRPHTRLHATTTISSTLTHAHSCPMHARAHALCSGSRSGGIEGKGALQPQRHECEGAAGGGVGGAFQAPHREEGAQHEQCAGACAATRRSNASSPRATHSVW